MFPGTVKMRKIKWNSKQEGDKSHNFKILQEAFKRLAIDKVLYHGCWSKIEILDINFRLHVDFT